MACKSSLFGHVDASRLDGGATQAKTLVAKTKQAHSLQLREGELASLRVEQRSTLVVVSVFDPSGRRRGRFDGTPGGPLEFSVRARSTGNYRLEVELPAAARAGEYELKLTALDMLAKQPRTAPFTGSPQSPRLRALLEASRTDSAAEAVFWHELELQGAPLVESTGDAEPLVTFVYRGDRSTRSVALRLPVFRPSADDGALKPLASTQVWFRSERFPAGTRISYQFQVNADIGPKSADAIRDRARQAVTEVDPLNRQHPRDEPPFFSDDLRSVLALPGAEVEAWLVPRPNIARGKLTFQRLKSQLLGNERTVALYRPAPEYGPPTAVVVMLDGERYVDPLSIPTPTLLDNLIGAGAIRSTVGVFVFNLNSGSRVDELTQQPKVADFLATELLQFVREHVKLDADATNIVLGGSSLGGLAAAYTAYRHPKAYGAVLSQSGSFWFWHSDGSSKDEDDWLIKRFKLTPQLPVRFYLEAGMLETGTGVGAIRDKNRLFRDVLVAKGYAVTHREFAGGHDDLAWRAGIAHGLIALLGMPR
jgi:enterochelin esterase family protein